MASQEVPVEDGEQSLKEKTATDQPSVELEHRGEIANLPPDPDAHLSPEERARIVRLHDSRSPLLAEPALTRRLRIANCYGNST